MVAKFASPDMIQNQRIKEKQKNPLLKRILIVDDEPDVTLTFKLGLEENNSDKRLEVYTYNNALEALRDVYPKARSIGCFIKKPVTIDNLVKRLLAELD